MRQYDKNKPLISLHIPKCGGQSIRRVIDNWFGYGNILPHYYDEIQNKFPPRYELRKGICIHGHFTKTLKIGVEDYYPEIDQFITFVRDPFEIAVSNYFYRKRIGTLFGARDRRRFQDVYPNISAYMRAYIDEYNSFFLDNLPFEITMGNYEEIFDQHFVYIGLVEYLQTSVNILAEKLGFPPARIARINTSERDEEVPTDLQEELFRSRPLEYAIYHYALKVQIEHLAAELQPSPAEEPERQLEHLTLENEYLKSQLSQLQNSLDGLQHSLSWKITEPLRAGKRTWFKFRGYR